MFTGLVLWLALQIFAAFEYNKCKSCLPIDAGILNVFLFKDSIDVIVTSTMEPKPDYGSLGYIEIPGFGWYKGYGKPWETWIDARERCKKDGADLMVYSKQKQKEIFSKLTIPTGWVGAYDPQQNKAWVTVKGDPVTFDLWSTDDKIYDREYCGVVYHNGLFSETCWSRKSFICEIM